MSFQMIRHSSKFDVSWDPQFTAEPLSETSRQDIGEFYHRIQTPLYHIPDGGTVEQGRHEVDRWIEHHRAHGDVDLAMKASTLVRLKHSGQLIAVCLVNACEPDHIRKVLHPTASVQMIDVDPDHQRCGLATRMIQRALTVVADERPAFDLWVEEDNRGAVALYETLDFVFTGIED
jgi:ribosomal protein S18 acetylase RimI-like enzyme